MYHAKIKFTIFVEGTLGFCSNEPTHQHNQDCSSSPPRKIDHRIGSESVKGQVNGFYGKSFICNRSGKIIAEASKDKEEVIIAEIDTEENHLFRRNWGLFRDRRPELYKEILSLNGETKD